VFKCDRGGRTALASRRPRQPSAARAIPVPCMRTRSHPRLSTLSAALAILLAALATLSMNAAASGRPARIASSYLTGVGDESPKMFTNPFWARLNTRIVRYIAPYDAAVHRDSLNNATSFIRTAEAAHVQVLVAFYHSEHTPTTLPSVGQYQYDVKKFVKQFPHVTQYQPWDEANRGNVPRAFSSPSARTAARYYRALIRACTRCTVIGVDVLDQQHIQPTLRYIAEFKSEIGRLRTRRPTVWGLHNYVDVNHLESWRTRQIARAFGGAVWLTETGGIVKFAHAFANRNGAGLARASNVLRYMFNVAASEPRIKRLYIYNWTGGVSSSRFDAGLVNSHGQPRPGYLIVCRHLHAASCVARLSKT
jgi:hypothetical protein